MAVTNDPCLHPTQSGSCRLPQGHAGDHAVPKPIRCQWMNDVGQCEYTEGHKGPHTVYGRSYRDDGQLDARIGSGQRCSMRSGQLGGADRRDCLLYMGHGGEHQYGVDPPEPSSRRRDDGEPAEQRPCKTHGLRDAGGPHPYWTRCILSEGHTVAHHFVRAATCGDCDLIEGHEGAHYKTPCSAELTGGRSCVLDRGHVGLHWNGLAPLPKCGNDDLGAECILSTGHPGDHQRRFGAIEPAAVIRGNTAQERLELSTLYALLDRTVTTRVTIGDQGNVVAVGKVGGVPVNVELTLAGDTVLRAAYENFERRVRVLMLDLMTKGANDGE